MSSMSDKGAQVLPQAVLEDVNWWRVCMALFNGQACILDVENALFAAVILEGNWFVFGVGEKCVWGSIEFEDISIPEVLIISATVFRMVLPESCRSKPAAIESIVLMYGLQCTIQAKGQVITLCCKYRKARNILMSAKVEFEWLLTVIHEFFWWCVHKDCYIESIICDFQAGWTNEWNT